MLNEPVLTLPVILDPVNIPTFLHHLSILLLVLDRAVAAGVSRVSAGCLVGPQQQGQSLVRMRTDGDKSVL